MTRLKASALFVLLCVVLALPVRAQPQVITMQNAATATGNGTAIVVSTSSSTSGSNHGAIGVQIIEVVSGTWEITFEKTSDGTNWTAVMATNEADDTRATTATGAGHYTVVIGSAVQFRARISSYSSGTITVKGRLTQGGVAFRTTSGGGGGGSGDVVGPASATDNAVARYNLTTGKLIQNSVVTIGDTGNTTGIADLTFTGVLTGGSAPTTITDSAGKILSAALNDVQFANFVAAGSAGFVGATGAGDYSHRTPTQVTAALDAFVGDSGSGGTKGLVPAPASGDAAANKYLKADGTWATVSAGSGITVGTTTVTSGTGGRVFYETTGNVVGQISTLTSDGTIVTFAPTVTTGTGATSGLNATANSLTTGDAFTFSSSSVTSGSIVKIASTSTAAASNTLTGLNIAISGANASSAQVVTGGKISVTNTNATSGFNYALQLTASGATGSVGSGENRAIDVTAGQVVLANADRLRPSLTFQSNKATGIYSVSNTILGFAINASEAMVLNNFDLVIQNNGSIGIISSSGTTADVILDRVAAAHWKWGSNTAAASPVAQTQSVQYGTGTNVAGATWTQIGSLGTGNAVPGRIHLAGGALSATSGTTQQTAIDRIISGATKVLTNNSATTIVNVTNASDTNAGGVIDYCVDVTDGVDQQYECGMVTYGVSNKGGVWSGNTATKFGNHQNATSGTLTVTFAISGANPALLSVNANSSLSPSTGFPRIVYSLRNLTNQAVAVQ